MNIEELNTQLEYLKETKNLIKEQLIAKGQPVDDNTTFREYVDNMDVLIDTENGNIETNDLELGKVAYSQGNEIIGTYDTEKDIGVQPLQTLTISDDQSGIQEYYANGVEQGGMEALANLKCWQIWFTEKQLNSKGLPTRHSIEFLSWTPAIMLIDGVILDDPQLHQKYLFNTAHTQLFMQIDTALGLGYTTQFLEDYNITLNELQAMSGWYEDIDGVLTPMNSNPSYQNLVLDYLFINTIQNIISGNPTNGSAYINIDEININCTYTRFSSWGSEESLILYIKNRYMNDGDAESNVIGKDKIAYTSNGRVIGTVPIIDTDNHYLLQKTETLNQGGGYQINGYYNNYNGTGVTELIMTNGDILDVSTLPENIENKNICIAYGLDKYNFDRWAIFIADLDTTFCFSAHDSTYAIGCRDKATRQTTRNMVYYQGYREHSDSNPLNINTVDWGTQKQFGPGSYLVELYLYSGYSVYATNDVYRGQFGTYSTTLFAGSEHYKYYVDTKLAHNSSPLALNQSLLLKSGSHIYTPINIDEIATKDNIVSSKIKAGENVLGVAGSVVELNGDTETVTPTTSQQIITPTSPKNGLTQVTVNAVTSAIDNNIQAGNIKSGVTILGVQGTYAGSTMKEYASEAAMNNDIENIDAQEIVKVVSGGVTTYYIKDGTPVTYQPLDLSTLAIGDTISLKGMKINNEATSNIITGNGDSKSITFSNNGQDVLELEFHGGATNISGSLTINGSTTYNYSGVTEGQNSTLSSADVEAINSNAIWNSDDLLTITKSYTISSREIENAILEQVGGYSMVKLVKESETISPQEFQENIELADEILGEEE